MTQPDIAPDGSDLSVVQRWFQAVVTHPDGIDAGLGSDDALELAPKTRDELETMVTRSEKVSARDRLSIYGNAYYARLIECLGESYPVLKRLLGDEAFNGFAFNYLQQYPSRSYTLGHLGQHFAAYLDETRPDVDEGEPRGGEAAPGWPDFLIDLAKLEWIIGEIFDGPGIEGTQILEARDLEAVAPHQWPELRMNTVPCLRLLSTRFPLHDYYTAARKQTIDEVDVPLPSPEDSYMAITRRDYVVRRHTLSHPQYILLNAMNAGNTLGEAIEAVAMHSDLDDDALSGALRQWFQLWTGQQFFASITVPD